MNWRLSTLIVLMAVLIYVLLSLGKGSPADVVSELLKGSIGSPRSLTLTLKETTPLLLMGLGVFIALRAGMFNIGMEGQFILGAFVAALVPLKVPGVAGVILGVLAGVLAGGLLALPAAWIRVKRGGHEVITTIMLNNIAIFVTKALAGGPFRSATEQDPRTTALAESSMISPLVHSGAFKLFPAIVLGVLLVVGFWIWLTRTVKGFELSAVGDGRTAAQFAGVDATKTMMRAFLISGALGGFAGAMQVFCHEGQFYDGMSPGYGFDALGVALLAGSNPLGLLPAAAVFGLLGQGQSSLSALGFSKGLTSVLLGCLIIVFAAVRYRDAKRSEA